MILKKLRRLWLSYEEVRIWDKPEEEVVVVKELADSSIILEMRMWVKLKTIGMLSFT